MENKTTTIKNISKDLLKRILKVIIACICIFILFFLFNLLFIIFRNIEYFHFGDMRYFKLLIQILIGLGFVIGALFLARSYIFINIVAFIYKYLTPFFKKLCAIIIDKVYSKSLNLSNTKHIGKALDVGSILKNSYERKIPRIIQKGVNFLINQIPFADFILNIQKEMKIEDGQSFDKELMSNKLYDQTNRYIEDSIFSSNKLYWVLWLFPLNVVVQLLVDYFM